MHTCALALHTQMEGISTMILDAKKGFPLSKETFFGEAVRASDNLAKMREMTEDTIVTKLSERYDEDVIYTLVGDILVACNPFKKIPLYGSRFQQLYLPGTVSSPVPTKHQLLPQFLGFPCLWAKRTSQEGVYRVAYCVLCTACCAFRISCCVLRISCCVLCISCCVLRISRCALRIS